MSLSEPGGKLRYQRWELSKDVSMVAFVPIPPDTMHSAVEEEEEGSETPSIFSDRDLSEVSSLHTKIMQLAEVYLAYELAKSSSVDAPKLIMLDNNIGGILANSSFSPRNIRLGKGDFDGESLSTADMHIALAHPFNKELEVPSMKKFQPHFRVIAEAVWKESKTISEADCPKFSFFKEGARYLQRQGVGKYKEDSQEFLFLEDPRASWRKTLRIFEKICESLFREKNPLGTSYKLKDNPSVREYFTPRDVMFLVGVGLRALIETCWQRKILLVGVVKDSHSRFFYRNFLGSLCVHRGVRPVPHLTMPLTDRSIIELLPNLDGGLLSPWGTMEFDSCFMTIHPEEKDGIWKIKGYDSPSYGETTRPERIFLRSIVQFFLNPDKSISSHALFVDRLAYPKWDDVDSANVELTTDFFGPIFPLYYDKSNGAPRLQKVMMYLLTVLVRNHFPEALGYPDPLHQADWGAKSMKRRIIGLLESSEWAFRARPLTKAFREIRDRFR